MSDNQSQSTHTLSTMDHELRHQLFAILASEPEINQRELSSRLGISLGKTNYCLQALIEKGWVKARNFRNNRKKLAYSYLLTPSGVEEKARLTVRFLRRKMDEYQELKKVIEELQAEVNQMGLRDSELLQASDGSSEEENFPSKLLNQGEGTI